MKPLRIILYPFGQLYGLGIAIRNLSFDLGWKKVHDMHVPIISVGNISIGGTGKTPMAEFLLRKLKAKGMRPAYLSRGYGRSTKGFLKVDPKASDGMQYGDEALQVASKFPDLPVAVCEDRVAGVMQLMKTEKPDIIILDDAFQHRRIHRDLDLVMVDGSRMPGKDALLPAGRLREPNSSLKRAHFVVLTKMESPEAITHAVRKLSAKNEGFRTVVMDLKPAAVQSFFDKDDLAPADLKGRKIILFSGLGNNAAFARAVQKLGAEILQHHRFLDHHDYQKAEFEKFPVEYGGQKENSGKFADVLFLTSEKDYFRLKSKAWLKEFQDWPLYYMQAEMEAVLGWEALDESINGLLKSNDGKN